MVIIPIIILVSLGPYNVGAALIGSGMSLGLMSLIFTRYSMDFNGLLIALIPVLILLGVLYYMSKGSGEDVL